MKFAAAALLSVLSGCVGAQAGDLSDDGLVAQATKIIHDKSLNMEGQTVLGTYHGQKVVVTSRCSDLCPVYTIRVVHFDVAADKCADVGGAKTAIMMPFSIAVRSEDLCIPAVLAKRQVYSSHPFQGMR